MIIKKILALLFLITNTAIGQIIIDTNLNILQQGSINEIYKDGNRIYVGGSFQWAGPNLSHCQFVDASNATVVQGFPKTNGSVESAISDGAGGWYICGSFTKVQQQTRNRLAHINSAGVVTNWIANADGSVSGMVKDGSSIYIMGYFNKINGQPRKYLAKLDAVTGNLLSWNPDPDSFVKALHLHGQYLYAGGEFDTIAGQPRSKIAALDTLNGNTVSWNPTVDSLGSVHALWAVGNTLYVGGSFTKIGSIPRTSLAAVDLTSGSVTSWNPVVNNMILSLYRYGGKLYVGGSFTTVNAQSRKGVAAFDLTTGNLSSWNCVLPSSSLNFWMLAYCPNGPDIFLGGYFLGGNGVQKQVAILKADTTTGSVKVWNPNISSSSQSAGIVKCIALSGNNILVAGDYPSINSQARMYLAAFDANTGKLLPWDPQIAFTTSGEFVSSIRRYGATLYIGGNFTAAGGQPRNRLAALDTATALATSWNPGSNGNIRKMEVISSNLYIAGAFSNIGGQLRKGLTEIDLNTGLVTNFNPSPNSWPITDMAVDGQKLYVCGQFDTIMGVRRNSLALINVSTQTILPWDPKAGPMTSPSVYATNILLYGPRLYVNGFFDTLGGQARKNLGCIDTITGIATNWNPQPNGGFGYPLRMAGHGSSIYVSGNSFTKIGGQMRRYVAAVDTLTSLATAWNPAPNGGVNCFYVPDSTRIYVGGNFYNIAGETRPMLASLSLDKFNRVGGKVFNDKNSNSLLDGNEYGLSNVLVKIQPTNYVANTDVNGTYHVYSPDTGMNTISIINPSYTNSVTPAAYNIPFSSYFQSSMNNDFAVHLTGGVRDMKISVTNAGPVRTNRDVNYTITAKNHGTELDSGVVKLVVDTSLQFLSSIPAPDVVSGDTLKWNFNNLYPCQHKDITATFHVSIYSQLGDTIRNIASSLPFINDVFTLNNTDTSNAVVTGSFDPNDKSVSPSEPYVPITTGSLTYTVRFQNTGTDTAFTVVVKDILDSDLDLGTFQMLSASHGFEFEIKNRELIVTFPNILLPDSFVNEVLSHGFFKFSISPNQPVSQGTLVNNSVGIYFDFNAPVVTNTTSTIFQTILTATNDPMDNTGSELLVFPNPLTASATLVFNKVIKNGVVSICNLLGETLSEFTISNIDRKEINLSSIPSGIYFLQVKSENGISAKKIIKE